MKKQKILSLFLSLLMLLSVAAVFGTTVSADETTTVRDAGYTDDMPTVLPDQTNVDSTITWIDWDVNKTTTTAGGTVTDGKYVSGSSPWSSDYAVNLVDETWRGASGFMFYVESPENNFELELMMQNRLNRPKDATSSGYVVLKTGPVDSTNGSVRVAESSTMYHYNDNEKTWQSIVNMNDRYHVSYYGSGWYYVPFTSIYYHGGSGACYDYDNDAAKGTNLTEYMSYCSNNSSAYKFYNISIQTDIADVKFSDIHFVYPQLECITSSVTSAVYSDDKTFKANDTTESDLFLGAVNKSIKDAEGLRFHVDTRNLGDAQLQLQIRLQMRGGPSSFTKLPWANDALGTVTKSTATSYVYLVARGNNSGAYYFDENGNAVPIKRASVSTDANSDLLCALPVGYVGDIYVPLDSFYASYGGYNSSESVNSQTGKIFTPWRDLADKVNCQNIRISNVCSGAADDASFVCSDFEWVYDDAAIMGANVTLSDNFCLNFYAKADSTVSDVALTSQFGSDDAATVSLTNDGNEIALPFNVLPQQLGDKVTLSLTGKINGISVTQKVEYSILDYCKARLKISSITDAEKNLLIAILNYGAQAQLVSDYDADNLVNAGYEDTTVVDSKTVTVGKSATASSDDGKSFSGATVRLESSVALRLYMNLDTTENVTVTVKRGDRTATYTADDIAKNSNGYTVLFAVNAVEYDDEITATISVDGKVVQTLTYSINYYLDKVTGGDFTADEAQIYLANKIYNYGAAASAYVEYLVNEGNS